MSYLLRWKKESNYSLPTKLLFFIISPFISLLYSLKSINTKSSFIIIFLFSICFGIAFTVPKMRDDANQNDGVEYRARFEQYCMTSDVEYYNGLDDFLSFNGENKDYYFDTIAFYVSKISHNYHVMFFVLSIVFVFFQLKCLKYFILNESFKVSLTCMLLLYLFTWNQIVNINGVRFWTAAWIGVYCIFKIFYDNKNRYLLLTLITPFFHGSFWIYIAVIFAAKFFARYEKLWIILFILSIITSNVLLEVMQGYTGYIPSFLENSIAYYTDEFYVNKLNSEGTGLWWIDKFFNILRKSYINILVIILILNRNKISLEKNDTRLYRFLLVLVTFANFGMSIPSLGNRFIILSYSIIAFLWLTFFKGQKYNWAIYIFPIAFFMSIYHQFNLYNLVTDGLFYISSPFILIPQYLF